MAQSHALDGQIEGIVADQTGAPLAGATVIAVNIGTGFTRASTTAGSGVYRLLLLPPGSYRVVVYATNFRPSIREIINLTTGQTATADFNLLPGSISESVKISTASPVTDGGRTDVGRVVNSDDVRNLPLPSHNPYNFAFLQPNVNGGTRPDFGFPRINANGYARRVNYLLDGNTNTQADRAGVRLLIVPETYISEVQLISNGFAAEFGNTPGLVMNLITASGTNTFDGAVSYRFARTQFYSRPFFYNSVNDIPENNVDSFAVIAGGPIIKDRWHFTSSYDRNSMDDRIGRLVNILPAHRDQLVLAGLSPSIFAPTIPATNLDRFYFLRTDVQLNGRNRLTIRFNHANGLSESLIRGDLNTLDRSTDTRSVDHAAAVQLVSFSPRYLNELRTQFAQRRTSTDRNVLSGSGPAVTIRNAANFGSPDTAGSISPLEKVFQVQDNFTALRTDHAIKFGGGFNVVDDLKRVATFTRYTFPSINAYVAARTGTNPRLYTTYEETFGDPEIRYRSTFWSVFVQDDWKASRKLKLNFGLRYDLYVVPGADKNAPFEASRKFAVDKNNFAPRLGIAYALRSGERPTVLRFGAGLYYDVPWLNMYERALLNNGNPRFFSLSMTSSTPGAPAFPNALGTLPTITPASVRDIDTIAPDLKTMRAAHFNIQMEQAVTEEMSVSVGFVHSSGRHITVYRNVNVAGIERRLADGRPVFSTERPDPRFNIIRMAESSGNSAYNAVSIQLARRFSRGTQFTAIYTLSRAVDDAPEQNIATPPFANLVLSDPWDRRLDKGNGFADQRHTFVMSMVFQPAFSLKNRLADAIFRNNQFSFIASANSGERFNIISGTDLNNDGITSSDRPVGIRRNSGNTPGQFNLDFRYSRFVRLTSGYRFEFFVDVRNLLNVNSIVSFTNVSVPTDPVTGEMIGPLPDFKARGQSVAQESRQAQVGIRFRF